MTESQKCSMIVAAAYMREGANYLTKATKMMLNANVDLTLPTKLGEIIEELRTYASQMDDAYVNEDHVENPLASS